MTTKKGPPRRRRERTVFHYKVDEVLRDEDRDAYLALLRDPRTRNEDAHRWLTDRGYALSLSAVARHRRRFLSSDSENQAALQRAEMFARLAGGPGAPDFAAGARVQLQHLVFQHLLELDEQVKIDSGELLQLSKLVAECVKMDAPPAKRRETNEGKSSSASAVVPRTDE